MKLVMLFLITVGLMACAAKRGPRGYTGSPGQDGAPGVDGTDGVLEVIDPCGPETDHDEVLFRLNNGKLYAFFEYDNYRFLTELTPGRYVTTDGTRCEFEVTNDLEVVEL